MDQFGGRSTSSGAEGKKFKAKAFKELLLSIRGKLMEAQKEIINETFENRRGKMEQEDDVCFIGARV